MNTAKAASARLLGLFLLLCAAHGVSNTFSSNSLEQFGMRWLLLSATGDETLEPQLGAARNMFSAYGLPVDERAFATPDVNGTVWTRKENFPVLTEEGSEVPRYAAVVLSTPELLYRPNVTTTYTSVLSVERWAELRDYERLYHVPRIVIRSNAESIPEAVRLEAEKVSATKLTFSKYAARWMSGLQPTLSVTLTVPTVTDGVTIVNDSIAHTMAHLSVPYGSSAGVEVLWPGGRRELHWFVTHSVHDLVAAALWSVSIQWASDTSFRHLTPKEAPVSMFVGSRRTLMWTQMDDAFLETAYWVDDLDAIGVDTVRFSGTDLEWHVAWMDSINARLGSGSSYRIGMPYNAEGVYARWYEMGWDPTYIASKTHRDKFNWLTHTYSHIDLTEVNQDPTHCDGRSGLLGQPTPYDLVLCELSRNLWLVDEMYNFPCTTGALVEEDLRKECATYSPHGIVTPHISGLHNGEALRAMMDSHIWWGTGDNSLAVYRPANPYHAIRTTVEEHGHEGFHIIPRHAAEIYYNAHTAEVNVAEYNDRNRVWRGRDITMDELLSVEATRMLPYLLEFRHDGVMFHQANLFVHEYKGRQVSLLSLWVEAVLAAYRKWYTLPVLGHKFDDVARLYIQRMKRDNCTYDIRMAYDRSTEILVGLNITSADHCVVGVTGVRVLPSNVARVEEYGPDVTSWITLDSPGQLFIPVDVPDSVIPLLVSQVFISGLDWAVYASAGDQVLALVNMGHPLGPGTRALVGRAHFITAVMCGPGAADNVCVNVAVTDHGNGSYALRSAPSLPGNYSLVASYNETVIGNAPSVRAVLPFLPTPTPSPPVPAVVQTAFHEVQARILILTPTGDASVDLALGPVLEMVQSLHVPFEVVSFVDPVTRTRRAGAEVPLLEDSVTHKGLFQALIFTVEALIYEESFGVYVSPLTLRERMYFTMYQQRHYVRTVVFGAFPATVYGLEPALETGTGTGSPTEIRLDPAADMTSLPGIIPNLTLVTVSEWHTPAAIIEPEKARAIACFRDPVGSVAVAETELEGYQQLHVFVGILPGTDLARLLSLLSVQWATRGTYVGYRRLIFSAVVEGLFSATNISDTSSRAGRYMHPGLTSDESSETLKSIRPFDFAWYNSWSTQLNQKLGHFSNFSLTWAFTGSFASAEMLRAFCSSVNSFLWVSGSYTGLNLAVVDQDPTMCLSQTGLLGSPTDADHVACEVQQNRDMTREGFCVAADDMPNPFSHCSFLMPMEAGLTNSGALQELANLGISTVLANSSELGSAPQSPIVTSAGVLVLPAETPSLCFPQAYDAATAMRMYEEVHVPALGELAPTLESVLQKDMASVRSDMVNFRPRVYKFHLLNALVAAQNASVLSLWVDQWMSHVRTFFSLPIISTSLDNLGGWLRAQMELDACTYDIRMAYDRSTEILVGLNITSADHCVVGVTGVRVLPSNVARVEEYGPDVTSWITLDSPGQLFIPVDVSPSIVPIFASHIWPSISSDGSILEIRVFHPLGPGIRTVPIILTTLYIVVKLDPLPDVHYPYPSVEEARFWMTQRADGVHVLEHDAPPGWYSIDVLYQGKSVQESPYDIYVAARNLGPTPSPVPIDYALYSCMPFANEFLFASVFAGVAVGLDLLALYIFGSVRRHRFQRASALMRQELVNDRVDDVIAARGTDARRSTVETPRVRKNRSKSGLTFKSIGPVSSTPRIRSPSHGLMEGSSVLQWIVLGLASTLMLVAFAFVFAVGNRAFGLPTTTICEELAVAPPSTSSSLPVLCCIPTVYIVYFYTEFFVAASMVLIVGFQSILHGGPFCFDQHGRNGNGCIFVTRALTWAVVGLVVVLLVLPWLWHAWQWAALANAVVVVCLGSVVLAFARRPWNVGWTALRQLFCLPSTRKPDHEPEKQRRPSGKGVPRSRTWGWGLVYSKLVKKEPQPSVQELMSEVQRLRAEVKRSRTVVAQKSELDLHPTGQRRSTVSRATPSTVQQAPRQQRDPLASPIASPGVAFRASPGVLVGASAQAAFHQNTQRISPWSVSPWRDNDTAVTPGLPVTPRTAHQLPVVGMPMNGGPRSRTARVGFYPPPPVPGHAATHFVTPGVVPSAPSLGPIPSSGLTTSGYRSAAATDSLLLPPLKMSTAPMSARRL